LLAIQINPHSGVPVYRQIIDQIKFMVSGGALKKGEQLPSIRDLARQLSLNPTTIAKAYELMAEEGLVEKKPGKGAFITDFTQALNRAEKENKLRDLARQLSVEADQLGLSPGAVMRILGDEMDRVNGNSK
jgi:GntR family transcriptional regulator